jgi:hypothetical protein
MFQDDINDSESYDEDAIRNENIIIASNDNSQDHSNWTTNQIRNNISKTNCIQESSYNSISYNKFDDINYLLDDSHDNSSIVDSSLSATLSHVTLNCEDPNFDRYLSTYLSIYILIISI